jgi:hypothetical protein
MTRVVLAIPRFRFIYPAAERFLVEALQRLRPPQWDVHVIPGDTLAECYLDEARERIAEEAVNLGADAVMMVDADQYVAGEETERLLTETIAGQWAALGVPYPCRGRGDPGWHHPPERTSPTEDDLDEMLDAIERAAPLACRGFIGGSAFAMWVPALARIPRPWFLRESTERMVGEDVWFSRRALAAGCRIGIHFGIRAATHYGGYPWKTDEMIARIQFRLRAHQLHRKLSPAPRSPSPTSTTRLSAPAEPTSRPPAS